VHDQPNTRVETSTRRVEANDFARQWSEVRDDALKAVDRVGRSGWLILGAEVREFEIELAAWWGIPHAVGVASGLDALEIALRCTGVQSGDRVLTTPFTAFATTLAILRAGATPVWCDVDESGGLDLDRAIEAVRADRTIGAVVPVHLYGHPLDPNALTALTELGVAVVEDCAQSAGATRDSRPTGLVGRAAATSLYPTKNLGAMGDGGVVLTTNSELATRARRLRDYGQARRYEHVEVGLNSRLDELHAAILRSALLPRLSAWIERRRQIADLYLSSLEDTPLRPMVAQGGDSANHLFPVEVIGLDPGDIAARLADAGISTGRHYPFVCADQPAAAGRGEALDPLTTARRLSAAELSLPIHPYLTDENIESVIDSCRMVCR
jgi:dTDP-4-amino-4,6-dideoxygalactose transaminase